MKIQEFRKKSVETSKNKGNFENANLQRKYKGIQSSQRAIQQFS